MDNASMFSEALGREEFMRQNRQEALGAAMGLFPQLQMSGADPMQAVLGRPSGALPFSQASGMQALGMGGNLGSSLFDPDAAINLAQAQNRNENMFNQSNFGSQAAHSGAVWGGALGGLGNMFSFGFPK